MEADPQWQQYVNERLEPRNALESVFAWKCGRPTVHEPSEPPRLPARPDRPPCLPACLPGTLVGLLHAATAPAAN